MAIYFLIIAISLAVFFLYLFFAHSLKEARRNISWKDRGVVISELLQELFMKSYFVKKEEQLKEQCFLAQIRIKNPLIVYYGAKAVIPGIVFLVLMLISATNVSIQENDIYSDFNRGLDKMEKHKIFEMSIEEYSAWRDRENSLSRQVLEQVNEKLYDELVYEERKEYMQEIVSRDYGHLYATERDLIVRRMMRKYDDLKSKRVNVGKNLFFAVILGFVIPDLILWMRKLWKQRGIYSEVEQLEMITILVGEGKSSTVEEILEVLVTSSVLLRPELIRAYSKYMENNEEGLMYLKHQPTTVFGDLSRALMQAQLNSKEGAIYNLKVTLEHKKKKAQDRAEDAISKKETLTLLIIVVPFAIVLSLWFYPLTRIFMEAV